MPTWKQVKDVVEARGVRDQDEVFFISIDWMGDIRVERYADGRFKAYSWATEESDEGVADEVV